MTDINPDVYATDTLKYEPRCVRCGYRYKTNPGVNDIGFPQTSIRMCTIWVCALFSP